MDRPAQMLWLPSDLPVLQTHSAHHLAPTGSGMPSWNWLQMNKPMQELCLAPACWHADLVSRQLLCVGWRCFGTQALSPSLDKSGCGRPASCGHRCGSNVKDGAGLQGLNTSALERLWQTTAAGSQTSQPRGACWHSVPPHAGPPPDADLKCKLCRPQVACFCLGPLSSDSRNLIAKPSLAFKM